MCITTYWDNFYQTKLDNHGTLGIWVSFDEGQPFGTPCVQPQDKKISFTKDVTFLHKSYGEWSTAEKFVFIPEL